MISERVKQQGERGEGRKEGERERERKKERERERETDTCISLCIIKGMHKHNLQWIDNFVRTANVVYIIERRIEEYWIEVGYRFHRTRIKI